MSCPYKSRSTSGYVLCSIWNHTARIRMRGALPWMLSVADVSSRMMSEGTPYQKQILNCSSVITLAARGMLVRYTGPPPRVFACSREARQRSCPLPNAYAQYESSHRALAFTPRYCTRGLTSASSALASSTASIFGPIAPRPAATSTAMMKVGRIPVLRNSAAFLINEFDTGGGAEERGKAKAFQRFDAGDVGCELHSQDATTDSNSATLAFKAVFSVARAAYALANEVASSSFVVYAFLADCGRE